MRHQRDDKNNFEGWLPRECGEHRTVGDYRAWCFDCSEWCYAADEEMACKGCTVSILRAQIRLLEDKGRGHA